MKNTYICGGSHLTPHTWERDLQAFLSIDWLLSDTGRINEEKIPRKYKGIVLCWWNKETITIFSLFNTKFIYSIIILISSTRELIILFFEVFPFHIPFHWKQRSGPFLQQSLVYVLLKQENWKYWKYKWKLLLNIFRSSLRRNGSTSDASFPASLLHPYQPTPSFLILNIIELVWKERVDNRTGA